MSTESPPADAEDPVAYFLQDMTYHGRAERTRDAYERVLRDFERFVGTQGATPASASQRECLAWVHGLRGDLAPSTVATYATYVHRFYAYLVQAGVFEENPMALVMAEMDESIDTDPARREVSVPAMREFVADIPHPLERALVVTLLKTGMRVGELCNLDLRDLNLDAPTVDEHFDARPRPQLDGRPDSLFVASDVARGQTVNGEERTASNKRKRATVVPVDDELASVLVRWLAIRPDTPSPARPLFAGTGDGWGDRLTPSQVRRVVRTHATARGWYRAGGDASENVTPHYFRHFFTTHLRDRTGDRGIVKYLRGDVATDIIDTYTHNWGDRVREVYEANIYRLS
ncbi:tyrosine-type recombinase/integrase [Halomarina litorea]|uniref:tyrosine-type recombinase/integrase n=1 Tax=Halomarina litorea TaxID=2961595 RepID=UPI0020C52858|nr:tyrosine-type recombinase/integrase [Halomarina sp. BCD28]